MCTFNFQFRAFVSWRRRFSLRTCIRYDIGTTRIADHLYERLFKASEIPKKDTNVVILIDTSGLATVSGVGKVYENFLKTGVLENFTGYGMRPAKFDEPHFEDAPIRMMTFAESFADMDYDCRESKLFFNM